MFCNLLKEQSGYSLVEVMVAIMLLGLAIIPMVSMFDAGLRAAVLGGNYDQARAIASEELAEIQALPFTQASTPEADSIVEIYSPDGNLSGTGVNCTPPITSGFDCKVKATYVRYRSDFSPPRYVGDLDAKTMVQATVTVTWDGKAYTTTRLVSKGAT